MTEPNAGVILRDIEGAPPSGGVYLNRNPSKSWPTPPALGQESYPDKFTVIETNGCVGNAEVHSCDSQQMFLTGITEKHSERFTVVESGTDPLLGNDVFSVYRSVANDGLSLDSDWQRPAQFTVAQYYAPIPVVVKAKAKQWLEKWEVRFKQIPASEWQDALTEAPVVGIITNSHPSHCVVIINPKQFFDSVGPRIRNISETTFHSFWQITLIPKGTKMPQIKSQAMGPSRRIVLEAATEAEWESLCNVFGKMPNTPDETVRPV